MKEKTQNNQMELTVYKKCCQFIYLAVYAFTKIATYSCKFCQFQLPFNINPLQMLRNYKKNTFAIKIKKKCIYNVSWVG